MNIYKLVQKRILGVDTYQYTYYNEFDKPGSEKAYFLTCMASIHTYMKVRSQYDIDFYYVICT